MYTGLHVKYPLFLSDINETWIFFDRFSKNLQISNFMKIRLLGAELFHADGQTGLMKPIVAFRNFANPSKSPVNQKVCIRGNVNPAIATCGGASFGISTRYTRKLGI
jgi:hypothetical protein